MDYGSDDAAVAAARRGERSAFEWLVRRHQQRVSAVALGILRNHEDARDACQEAFLRAWRGLDRFDGAAKFSTWLHRIVINICIDRRRQASHIVVAIDEAERELAGDDDPRRNVEGARLGTRIGAALDALSPKHRTVLVLRELQGLSYAEIAEVMRCSVGTVMSRLFHARKRMQHLLRQEAPALAAAA